jgi:hypothetical protein
MGMIRGRREVGAGPGAAEESKKGIVEVSS